MRFKNTLITGGSGQLGMALRRLTPLDDLAHFYSRERFDLDNAAKITTLIRQTRPAVVVNCAAYTDVRGSEENQQAAWSTNAQGVGVMAKCLAELNIPLIHVSTDFVFGMQDKRTPYHETDVPAPVNAYGLSKLLGEYAIHAAGNRWPNWPYYIIRTAGVFELPWRSGKNFPFAIATALRQRKTVHVVNDVHTNITSAESLAWALDFVLQNHPDMARGCYHVTGQGSTTWFEIATHLADRLQWRGTRVEPTTAQEFETARGCDPRRVAKYTCLDSSRYHDLPEAPPMPSWEESIDKWAIQGRSEL